MTKPSSAGRQAREQASAYRSVFAPTILELDGGVSVEIPPHPNLRMLDDDRQEAYEELLFETESYDRGPEIFIPEQRIRDADGNDTGVVLPAETRPGRLLEPYRKDGQLVKPPHSVRVVQVCLGDAVYAKLRAAGKSAADVWRIWNEQGLRISERADGDPKSNGSSNGLAAVSAADSG